MKIIKQIGIGLLVAAVLFLYFDRGCQIRKLKDCNADYADVYDSLKNAKTLYDTIIRKETNTDTITIYSLSIETDTAAPTSEPITGENCPQNKYEGKFETDLLSIRWRAVVFGELASLQVLPGSGYKFREIRIEKTVTLAESRRNAFSTSDCYQKSHLWIYGGVNITSGIKGANIGLMYTRRGKWGIAAGVSTVGDEWHYQGSLIFRLK